MANADQERRQARIVKKGNQLQLLFSNAPHALQSAIDIDAPHKLLLQNLQYLMGILLFMPPPEKILMLGVGAGSLLHFFHHYLPDCHITGVDLDADLLELAQREMLLPRASDRIEYVIADARDYIGQCNQGFDLIVVDLFSGSQSPRWLLQENLTLQLKNRLGAQGGLAYNLLISSASDFKQFYAMLRRVFAQQTLCLECGEYENQLIYALNYRKKSASMQQLIMHAEQAQLQYELPFAEILSAIYSINPVDSGII